MFGAVFITILALVTLLDDVASDGLPKISSGFLTSFPSRIIPERSGIQSALYGTLWLMVICAVIVIPLGVATAVYLEEYADRTRWWNRFIEVNIQNLAAVPSVVYGILGLAFIVRGPMGLGRTILAGGITLSLLVLPVVIIVAREAIRGVPPSIREGSLALGATQWQTIWKQVLPGSIAGIATGVILALSRAIGETAPLLVIGAATNLRFNPTSLGLGLHGAADPDLRLDAGPQPGVRRPRRRDYRRDDGRAAGDELSGHLPPQPLRAEVVIEPCPSSA